MRNILLLAVASTFVLGQATKTPWTDLAMRQKQVAGNLIKSAEKMPEESWGFKPSHDVMAFQEFVGHLAGANYMFCSAVKEEPNPGADTVKAAKGKAALTAALTEALNYCDKVYAALAAGEIKGDDMIKQFGGSTKAGALMLNTAHDFEHYGNLVTYLRIRGFVPPSSERPATPAAKPRPPQ